MELSLRRKTCRKISRVNGAKLTSKTLKAREKNLSGQSDFRIPMLIKMLRGHQTSKKQPEFHLFAYQSKVSACIVRVTHKFHSKKANNFF